MSISVTCPKCGEQYDLADELAGRKAKCQNCGEVTVVPQHEITPGGSTVYRHEQRTTPFTPASGDLQQIELISAHIEKHCGKVEMVWHEIISDLVHIDLHWVKPSAERPFHFLVTSGMSEKPMTVPAGAEEWQYAELCLALPASWPMSQEAFEDENNYWPLRWLKMLARLPHEFETWLGDGHTIPHGDPPTPYATGTKLCCALVGPLLAESDEFCRLEVADRVIHFYGVHFLYREEMNFKLHRGADGLYERMTKRNVSSVLDPKRPNVCKPWWKMW